MAGNEKITLLNRAGHAPRLRDSVNGGTANGYVLTWDAATAAWYPSDAGSGGTSAPAVAEYVTLSTHTGLPNERVLAVGPGLTKTDNGAGATVQIKVGNSQVTNIMLANDSLTITAGSGLAGGGVVSLGGSATLTISTDNTTIEVGLNGVQIKAGGVGPDQLAIQPRQDGFTGNGQAAAFNLTTRIVSPKWRDGAIVARNGQLLRYVSGEPSDVSQFTVSDNGSATTITLGAALPNGDQLTAMYWA
ncbi:MAG TPA: hypothetical protein EYN66_21510 [Myxococcales bacterium]|nr:hypothetical protein [Myxococcales bacterium]